MTAAEARQITFDARCEKLASEISDIEKKIESAALNGEFSIYTAKLSKIAYEYLIEAGFHIIQSASQFDPGYSISWNERKC